MRLGIFILFIAVMMSGYSQDTKLRVEIDPSSQLQIKGRTNVVSFVLEQDAAHLVPQRAFQLAVKIVDQNRYTLSQNTLNINVKNFTSNNPMALRDFLKLIKSNEYPQIKVILNYMDIKSGEKKDKKKGVANVTYTITGVSKTYQMNVVATSIGDKLVLDGEKRLSIKDFGLEPPSPLMGLIKVSEWIDIHLKLVCKADLL